MSMQPINVILTNLFQVKHENRKSWDAYVQQLETVDLDTESGSEVVHWVMKFPVSYIIVLVL